MSTDRGGHSWESKLADPRLRELSDAEGATLSVIVHLELPRPHVEMEGSDAGGVGAVRARRVAPESEDEQRESAEVVTRARVFLEQLLGRPPVWLGAARAFGVEASREQLHAIARSPLVRRVYLSRARR